MEKLKVLHERIEKMRQLLGQATQVKVNLMDPEVLYISQQLDCLLNDYHKLYAKIQKIEKLSSHAIFTDLAS